MDSTRHAKYTASSYLKVGNESMSVIQFCTTPKENLTHLYYIFHHTDPLGSEFKTVDYYVTGDLILLDIHRGKEGMKLIRNHL